MWFRDPRSHPRPRGARLDATRAATTRRPPIDHRRAFVDHYPALRALALAARGPGVLMAAVDVAAGAVVAHVHVEREVGRVAALIVGRHARADLVLADD